MELWILYSCITRSQEYCSWLVNVLDRASLHIMCQSGSPLQQQDLAQCVREHVAETVDQLNEQDKAEDSVFETEGA